MERWRLRPSAKEEKERKIEVISLLKLAQKCGIIKL